MSPLHLRCPIQLFTFGELAIDVLFLIYCCIDNASKYIWCSIKFVIMIICDTGYGLTLDLKSTRCLTHSMVSCTCKSSYSTPCKSSLNIAVCDDMETNRDATIVVPSPEFVLCSCLIYILQRIGEHDH